MRKVWTILKGAVDDFMRDDVFTLAAALGLYTALSLAPLLIILLSIAGFLGEDTQSELVDQIRSFVGKAGGDAIGLVLENADERQQAGKISAIVGIVTLLFSATAVFAQLQYSLNRIWGVQVKPGKSIQDFIQKRLLSFGMILAIAFLLLVSLMVSAALELLLGRGGDIWRLVNFLSSLFVYLLLFAILFKFLPDVKMAWGDVWIGAGITTALFAVGKFAIGKYLGTSTVGSAYGAAGSLVVLLVWVYYSAVIFFFGAELTQNYAKRFGSRMVPDRYAEWMPSGATSG